MSIRSAVSWCKTMRRRSRQPEVLPKNSKPFLSARFVPTEHFLPSPACNAGLGWFWNETRHCMPGLGNEVSLWHCCLDERHKSLRLLRYGGVLDELVDGRFGRFQHAFYHVKINQRSPTSPRCPFSVLAPHLVGFSGSRVNDCPSQIPQTLETTPIEQFSPG